MSGEAGEAANGEIARLEAIVDGDPGAPAFPALAEAQRRAGRAEAAERTARAGLRHRPDQVSGRVVLGLALLDLGRDEDARLELQRVLEAAPDQPIAAAALERLPGERLAPPPVGELDLGIAELDDGEIEGALACAETATDELIDADDIARAAMRVAELDRPEGVEREVASPFATRTMADLLDRQGHTDDARLLRESIGGQPPPPSPGTAEREPRADAIRTLEHWLENLRRGTA